MTGLQIAMMVVMTLLGALGSLLAYRHHQQGKDIERLQASHQALLIALPKHYVLKEDYVRQWVRLETKTDALMDAVGDVKGLLVQHINREESA